jgi:hypothetical protein
VLTFRGGFGGQLNLGVGQRGTEAGHSGGEGGEATKVKKNRAKFTKNLISKFNSLRSTFKSSPWTEGRGKAGWQGEMIEIISL